MGKSASVARPATRLARSWLMTAARLLRADRAEGGRKEQAGLCPEGGARRIAAPERQIGDHDAQQNGEIEDACGRDRHDLDLGLEEERLHRDNGRQGEREGDQVGGQKGQGAGNR